jgi:hypothetical protein
LGCPIANLHSARSDLWEPQFVLRPTQLRKKHCFVKSGLVDNAISHDPVTRFLSQQDFTSKELGKVIKKTVREIETGEGVLIFDD